MTTRPNKSVSVQHKTTPTRARFVVCVNNADYPVSLEKRKLYQVLSDPQARRHNLLRVIDESGEDYLYPTDWFIPIAVTRTVAKALAFAA